MNKEQFRFFKPYIYFGASITFYGYYYKGTVSYFSLFCCILSFIIGVLFILKNNNDFYKKTKSKLILIDPIITIICAYISLFLPLKYNLNLVISITIALVSAMFLSAIKLKKINNI